MEQTKLTPSGKPFDIHERLLLFACDIVRVIRWFRSPMNSYASSERSFRTLFAEPWLKGGESVKHRVRVVGH